MHCGSIDERMVGLLAFKTKKRIAEARKLIGQGTFRASRDVSNDLKALKKKNLRCRCQHGSAPLQPSSSELLESGVHLLNSGVMTLEESVLTSHATLHRWRPKNAERHVIDRVTKPLTESDFLAIQMEAGINKVARKQVMPARKCLDTNPGNVPPLPPIFPPFFSFFF